jgi:hypothetical protein
MTHSAEAWPEEAMRAALREHAATPPSVHSLVPQVLAIAQRRRRTRRLVVVIATVAAFGVLGSVTQLVERPARDTVVATDGQRQFPDPAEFGQQLVTQMPHVELVAVTPLPLELVDDANVNLLGGRGRVAGSGATLRALDGSGLLAVVRVERSEPTMTVARARAFATRTRPSRGGPAQTGELLLDQTLSDGSALFAAPLDDGVLGVAVGGDGTAVTADVTWTPGIVPSDAAQQVRRVLLVALGHCVTDDQPLCQDTER